jgi:hypothetical protein
MKVAVVTIHGIGSQDESFADKFHSTIIANTKGIDVRCFSVCWQNAVEPTQKRLFQRLRGLKLNLARKLMLSFVGDALNYHTGSKCYRDIHQRIDQILAEANAWVEDGCIVIAAHSLGSIAISNFIWDCDHPFSMGNQCYCPTDEAVQARKKIECLYTLGSPLYISSMRYEDGGEPIHVEKLINIYSKFDIVSYPVKDINSQYARNNRVIDKQISVGGIISRWTPFSHVTYFDDKKVSREITGTIKNLQYPNPIVGNGASHI